MSQRNSEYQRMAGDTYVTPQWVWDALYAVEPWAKLAVDCAPVYPAADFLQTRDRHKSIATNPPFKLAEKFVRHALELTKPDGKVAMLLPHTWDTAKSRIDLFDEPLKTKYAITRRIRWENLEQKKNGPSSNHAWFVWDWNHEGPPTMGWL